MSRANMNRRHEIEEGRLIVDLERLCRRLPKGMLPTFSRGNDRFPPVPLFSEIHKILDRLTQLRTMVLVPTKGASG